MFFTFIIYTLENAKELKVNNTKIFVEMMENARLLVANININNFIKYSFQNQIKINLT